MTGKYIAIDLHDPRSARIAEVLANSTCKKILELLADEELSESDIALRLKLPLNTVHYNVQKLTEAGFIEKARKFFWSSKGRRIVLYKVSQKKIIISPKSFTRGVVPAIIISGIITFAIKIFTDMRLSQQAMFKDTSSMAATISAGEGASGGSQTLYGVLSQAPNIWAWFLLGALTAIVVFMLWNFRKR